MNAKTKNAILLELAVCYVGGIIGWPILTLVELDKTVTMKRSRFA